MSWQASHYAKTLVVCPNGEKITRTEKCLLLVLADYHNTARKAAYPSVPVLAEESIMDERTARRTLKSLEEKQVLRTIRPEKQGRGEYLEYQFLALMSGSDTKQYQPTPNDIKGDTAPPFPEKKEDTTTPLPAKKGDRRGTEGGQIEHRNKEEYRVASNTTPAVAGKGDGRKTLKDRIETFLKELIVEKTGLATPDWNGRDRKVLNQEVDRHPKWTGEDWKRMLYNLKASDPEMVGNFGRKPCWYIQHIAEFSSGPKKKFVNGKTARPDPAPLSDTRQQELLRRLRPNSTKEEPANEDNTGGISFRDA